MLSQLCIWPSVFPSVYKGRLGVGAYDDIFKEAYFSTRFRFWIFVRRDLRKTLMMCDQSKFGPQNLGLLTPPLPPNLIRNRYGSFLNIVINGYVCTCEGIFNLVMTGHGESECV